MKTISINTLASINENALVFASQTNTTRLITKLIEENQICIIKNFVTFDDAIIIYLKFDQFACDSVAEAFETYFNDNDVDCKFLFVAK